MKLKNILLLVLVSVIAATILKNPSLIVAVTGEAIQNCIMSVVPSLMSFMIVACFVSESSCGDVLGRIIPTRFLFNLPQNCGKTVLLSMLGGYPCGAKMIAKMLDKNEIDVPTAQRMLNFCINASPAYVISAVGIGLFDNAKIGVIIWAAHAFTAILIGVVFRGKTATEKTNDSVYLPAPQAFVKSVLESTTTMTAISGFVITFSVALSLLKQIGIAGFVTNILEFLTGNKEMSKAIFDTFFDVVVGSKTCLECSPVTAVLLCSGAVSFGGLNIWSQVAYLLSGQKLKFFNIIFFRFAHAVLTVATVYIIMSITDTEVTTANLFGSNVENTPMGYVTTMLFLLCCTWFVATADREVTTLVQRRRKV